jgi:tetratricopeptide (TPR) repeat protein
MLFRSRLGIWLVAAAGLTAIVSGCSLAPKTDALSAVKAAAKQQQQQQETGSATPGSADFSSSNKLTNPVKVHLAYALWHEQQGNQVEARNSYNEVLKKNSKNIDAHLGLARLDMQLQRMSDAEARLQKAQKIAPRNPQVVAAVGQYHAVQRDWPRALEQMRAARTLSPYEPTYAFQLGVVEARSGDMVAALTSFSEAVGPAEAHYNLAVILQEQGQSAEAENHLQQALALKADLPHVQKLLTAMRQQRQADKLNAARSPLAKEAVGTDSRAVQPASFLQPAGR